MPLFEFVCEQCQHEAELLVGRTEQPACPSCGSPRMQKQLSVFAGRVAGGSSSLPMASACPPPETGPCSPHCCRIPQ